MPLPFYRRIQTHFVLLTGLLLCSAGLVMAVPVTVLAGTAKTPAGVPLAGAKLYWGGLPLSSFPIDPNDPSVATTDSQGRFTWKVPAGGAWDVDSLDPPPPCYVLPMAPGWRMSPSLSNYTSPPQEQRNLMEAATRQCDTHWNAGSPTADVDVIVPDAASVTVRVRNPDGRALIDHIVMVIAHDWSASNDGAVIYSGQTDTEGRLHLQLYPGIKRLLVSAPGVGFGSTGTFQLQPYNDATPDMPPLAPYASISGTVDPHVINAASEVVLDDRGTTADYNAWNAKANVSADGTFTLIDVMPGYHRLKLIGGKVEGYRAEVAIAPSQQVRGLVLTRAGPARYAEPKPIPIVGEPELTGRVTDISGAPVGAVHVFAVCDYFGPMQLNERILSAITDARGGYKIADLPQGESFAGANVFAVSSDSPIAVGAIEYQTIGIMRDLRANLVLSPIRSGLTISVRHGGIPVANACVQLTLQSVRESARGRNDGSPEPADIDLLQARLRPVAVTDANGDVHFSNLVPGLYDVSAVASSDTNALYSLGYPRDPSTPLIPYSVTRNVAVTDAHDQRFAVNIYQQRNVASYRILGPDATPPAFPTIDMWYGYAANRPDASTAVTIDESGDGSYNFVQSGLYMARFHYRDVVENQIPWSTEPFYDGSAVFAVSPALMSPPQVVVNTVKRGPGSIRARMVDAQGRPSGGTVVIGDPSQPVQYAASLTPAGEVLFSDMPSGKYWLRAYPDRSSQPPNLGGNGFPLASDTKLSGIKLPAVQTVEVTSDTESSVTFAPSPVGYIRGKLSGKYKHSMVSIYKPTDAWFVESPYPVSYDRKTGEFVAGPIPPGKATVYVHWPTAEETWPRPITLSVEPGRVAYIDLRSAATSPASADDDSPLLTFGPARETKKLTGFVYEADGKTPAEGAQSALISPTYWFHVADSRTDASGRMIDEPTDNFIISRSYDTDDVPTEPTDGPTEPVIVAWLPGRAGATIVPYVDGKDVAITLPPRISLRGRVTVGGGPVGGLPSSFQIRAAYQGRGKLNALLSVDTSAQADGSFALGGLTPGTYIVQAARDGIWLAQSVTVTVGDKPLAELTLDIAPPGAPMLLRFVDENAATQAGAPLKAGIANNFAMTDLMLHFVRPEGPLADELWPNTLRTDCGGTIRLDGLEVGDHKIDVRTTNGIILKTVTIHIPPLDKGAPVTSLTIAVPR